MASDTTRSETARSTNTLGLLVQRRILSVIWKNIRRLDKDISQSATPTRQHAEKPLIKYQSGESNFWGMNSEDVISALKNAPTNIYECKKIRENTPRTPLGRGTPRTPPPAPSPSTAKTKSFDLKTSGPTEHQNKSLEQHHFQSFTC